ncbi:sigma factor-like helix-turn-helix DNA-binding protein [Paenibacillus harenae]|uniref:sigma factor-like helix-turn-helix DNA-binding protein n=1 Tax=Paenibacillus harenae TaxID=306543 RepID=UPI00048ED2A2|nr:sigma factor-like helix-turn-helix DNA-binding protein [Paenibacillus harenae]
MNRENVTELLKNYRNYKYAVNQYERHRPRAAAGIANYDAMPSGSGAAELFFVPNGRMADMGHTGFQDRLDYNAYAEVVRDIEGGLETLTEEEQSVIKLKWMDKLSLQQIADRKHLSVGTIKSRHKSALASLGVCFRFVKPPHIEEIHDRGTHMHHGDEKRRTTDIY